MTSMNPADPLREALAADVARVAGCQIGSERTRKIVDYILEREALSATREEGGAVADVIAERLRQIDAEGWTAEHDDRHGDRSLPLAAACYALFASVSDAERASTDMPAGLTTTGKPLRGWAAFLTLWPWDRKWWKPKSRRRDLVRAAALIVAEIERLDRREKSNG